MADPAAGNWPVEITRLQYFRAYQQALDSPNWFVNLLWGMLAFFSSGVVPMVGPMVWTGYQYECVEVLWTSRGRILPDFDVNRFGDYLGRGVLPFLVQLASWFGLAAAYILLYVFMFLILLVASAVGEEHLGVVFAVGGMLYGFTVAAIVILPLVLLAPLMLRLGLSQDLKTGFDLRWCLNFLRRMWPETVLSTLFILTTGLILTTLGCVLLIIGSYAAWGWVALASAHQSWQLYELYLARGGEPVPLKPRKVVPPPVRYQNARAAGEWLPPPKDAT